MAMGNGDRQLLLEKGCPPFMSNEVLQFVDFTPTCSCMSEVFFALG